MEIAYKDSDLQKVERILKTTTDFKYFEQATNLLLQAEMLSIGKSSSIHCYIVYVCIYLCMYVYVSMCLIFEGDEKLQFVLTTMTSYVCMYVVTFLYYLHNKELILLIGTHTSSTSSY